jgi:predicted ABC-type ATPase
VAVAERAPILWVAAGPNGAGKSSIVGEMIRQSGADYFNPDEVARRLRELQPGLLPERANELAWKQGKRLLEESIAKRRSFAFETTLGGRTISQLLHAAIDVGFEVRMWFLALESADRHVERVKARVVEGGHDIPEDAIRERYDRSRHNLTLLLPRLSMLKVYDNSRPVRGAGRPALRLVLDWRDGAVLNRGDLAETPDWAKAIVAAALVARKRLRR